MVKCGLDFIKELDRIKRKKEEVCQREVGPFNIDVFVASPFFSWLDQDLNLNPVIIFVGLDFNSGIP